MRPGRNIDCDSASFPKDTNAFTNNANSILILCATHSITKLCGHRRGLPSKPPKIYAKLGYIGFFDYFCKSMANSPTTVLGEIQQHIEELGLRLQSQKNEIQTLKSEKESLQNQISELKKELHRARLDAEYLSLSHNLASTPEALSEARLLVNDLIRKVDAAIAAVRTDPGNL